MACTSTSHFRLSVSQKMFNRNSVSPKNLLTPLVVRVAAPPLQIRRITTKKIILQNSRAELYPPVSDSDQTTELERSVNVDHGLLADMWKEIQGSHHWNGLLNPLHPILLTEIIRYGVFVLASYEAFDWEPRSKYYGSYKYGRKSLLSQLGMESCGYQVTKYIYAPTPDINVPNFLKNMLEGRDRSNWIGYVAVSDDENEIKRLGRRDIVVAFRGTATCMEWLANFMHTLTPARFNPLDSREDVRVEMGFLSLYTSHDSTCRFNHGSAREQLLCEIGRLVQKYKGEEISLTITGHSMGSALATLCAYDIAELELNRRSYGSCCRIPITVYSFAGPRVGNVAFKDRCDELGVRILRVANVHDVVTKIPGVIFNEKFRLWKNMMDRISWTYSHVGVELALDHKICKEFFKVKTHHPSCIHDLATYLQVLTCRCSHHHEHVHQACNDQQLDSEGNTDSGCALVRHLRSVFEKYTILFICSIFFKFSGKEISGNGKFEEEIKNR